MFRAPHCWVITVITVWSIKSLECMCLTVLFRQSKISHTFTPMTERTRSCRQTYTPIHKPLHRCLLCWVQEWMELMWNVWIFSFVFFFLSFLWSRHAAVYLPVRPKWSMSTIIGLWQTKSAAVNLRNLSYAVPLVAVPPCPCPPTSPYFVYTKTWRLDTLHSQRRKKTKMRYR